MRNYSLYLLLAIPAILNACMPSHVGDAPENEPISAASGPAAPASTAIPRLSNEEAAAWQPAPLPDSDSLITFRFPELSVTLYPYPSNRKKVIDIPPGKDTIECGELDPAGLEFLMRSKDYLGWDMFYSFDVQTGFVLGEAKYLDWPGLHYRWIPWRKNHQARYVFPGDAALPDLFTFVRRDDWLDAVRNQFGDETAQQLADVNIGDERIILLINRLVIKLRGVNPNTGVHVEKVLRFELPVEGC